MNKAQIIVICHGENKDNYLTPKGAIQCFTAAQALEKKGYKFDRLFYSGAPHAWQSALVMAAAIGKFDAKIELNYGFLFSLAFRETFNNNGKLFFEEMKKIKNAGGKISNALNGPACTEEYVKFGYYIIKTAIIKVARKMAKIGQKTALAVSHSPWAELAVINPNEIPYGLAETDAILYVVDTEKERIIDSKLIQAPSANEGKSLG